MMLITMQHTKILIIKSLLFNEADRSLRTKQILICALHYVLFVYLGPLSSPLCPYCRQRWTLLVPFFSESEHSTADLEEIEQRNHILNYINDFNRRFSGKDFNI